MENFNSSRIAINEKFYKENDKLLEGGIWAEVTIAHNDVEDDNYAFYVEDLNQYSYPDLMRTNILRVEKNLQEMNG